MRFSRPLVLSAHSVKKQVNKPLLLFSSALAYNSLSFLLVSKISLLRVLSILDKTDVKSVTGLLELKDESSLSDTNCLRLLHLFA